MSEQDLRAALEKVHAELSGGQPLTGETRALLRAVLADIEQRLEPAGDEPEGPLEGLAERVRETTQEIEGRYPRLTAALEEMATVLSRMGI